MVTRYKTQLLASAVEVFLNVSICNFYLPISVFLEVTFNVCFSFDVSERSTTPFS